MQILVIEDKKKHQQSARETLAGHELTIVGSFDKAMELMEQRVDKDNVRRLLVEAGLETIPSPQEKERWSAYWDTLKEAETKSVIPFPFEVVLTDMMMPMSEETIASRFFKQDEQVPYGFTIALRAALAGAKYVAMVTDTNHHQGAMSASLDHLGGTYYNKGFKPNFVINGAKCAFLHTPFVKRITKDVPCDQCTQNPGACSNCNGTGLHQDPSRQPPECYYCRQHGDSTGKCSQCKGTTVYDHTEELETKDWGQVLTDLISE